LFDVVMGYPDSLRLKPRPEPFLEMARRLDVKPESILYVGNKLDYDVFGARNAGLRGALIGAPGRKVPSNITFYRDYTQLADDILSEVAP
jgi:putative hydrolase of the HAD superfamily